ncbi:MAG: ATP-binding cassette domain-containing protein, partial [Deltaproteobacteria bacterium]|nr:ATP-binding cassette domain-containing protein [Deltaproteobacteria bacterium]
KIGFVFQAYNLIPVLTAIENVEYILLLQGVDARERQKSSVALLERVGLADQIQKRPSEMSGGQQQRVAVARALASHPEMVLADEPTANLDSTTGSALIDLFRELNKQFQTTFIFASHDPMVIERARRVVRLKDGCVES